MRALCRGVLVVSVGSAVLAPARVHSQQAGWSGHIEANGNLLFGNASDQLVGSQVRIGRADSVVGIRTDARFTYGAARSDQGKRHVTARAALASLGIDYLPFHRYSPFAFGSIESSLQQQIARRIATGVGAKLTFHQQGDDETSISLAVLAEQTRPRQTASALDALATTWRGRWSLRARTRKQLTGALRLTHVTFYQPSIDRVARYTIESTTTLAMAMTEIIAFTATLHDTYDSEARGRGARSNNDGQILFGIRAEL